MAPLRLRYLGKFGVNEDECGVVPCIRSISWCMNPETFAPYGVDVIAVTGAIGTVAYGRLSKDPFTALKYTHQKNFSYNWKELFRMPELKGSIVAWNPNAPATDGNLSGHLVVVLRPTSTEDGKVVMLRREKNWSYGRGADVQTIYDASEGCPLSNIPTRKSILSLEYLKSGKQLLIFQDFTTTVCSKLWVQGADRRWSWKSVRVVFDANELNHLVGCAASHADKKMFAAANSSKIKLYKGVSDDNIQWEVVSETPCTDVVKMAFSPNDNGLAVLNLHGQVSIFTVWHPLIGAIRAQKVFKIEPLATIPVWCKTIAWTMDNIIVVSGNTMQTVYYWDLFADKAAPFHEVQLLEGPLGVHPFNTVHHLICPPLKSNLILILGDKGLLHSWGSRSHYQNVERDLLMEKFPTTAPLEEDQMPTGEGLFDSLRSGILQLEKKWKETKGLQNYLKDSMKRTLNAWYQGCTPNVLAGSVEEMLQKLGQGPQIQKNTTPALTFPDNPDDAYTYVTEDEQEEEEDEPEEEEAEPEDEPEEEEDEPEEEEDD